MRQIESKPFFHSSNKPAAIKPGWLSREDPMAQDLDTSKLESPKVHPNYFCGATIYRSRL